MMERRDEPLADLAPTSEAINQQKQKRGPGGSGVGRRRKLGTGTTVQPEIEGGVAVPKAVPSTSNGSGAYSTDRSGGKGKRRKQLDVLLSIQRYNFSINLYKNSDRSFFDCRQ